MRRADPLVSFAAPKRLIHNARSDMEPETLQLRLFEAGHGNLPRFQVEQETLDWFERHLGAASR